MKSGGTMPRHLLEGVEAFVMVAELRNFRAAAKRLLISPSALSQKIRAMELRMGLPLLTRTTRNVGLTQAGQIFLERARPALADMNAAYETTRNLAEPAGLLRLKMPRGVIPLLIEPILAGFCAAYPKIDLEIDASEDAVNLVDAGFDAGVQLGELLDADMVALRLTSPIRFAVVGSPKYFETHGRPSRPSELRHHDCVRVRLGSGALGQWSFLEDGTPHETPVNGRIITNDYSLALNTAKQGLCLCYSARSTVEDGLSSGELEVVLEGHMPSSSGVFLYYPNRAQALPKLRAFIDYVQDFLLAPTRAIADRT